MDLEKLRQELTMSFKLNGFSIRRESSLFLSEQLITLSQAERNKQLEKIINHIQNQGLLQPLVEKKHAEIAFKECGRTGLEDLETIFSVINVFDVPKFNYNIERKKFLKDENNSCKVQLYASPTWKAQYLIDRYTMILQRTVRNKLFAPETLPGFKQEKAFNLRKVEGLISSSSRINEVIVLGLLTQLTEGTYHLEDPTGAVALDLTSARFHSGLFTENCFVLAEGHYEDQVLYVMGLVMPPPESQAESQVYFGSANTFGGPAKCLLKNSKNLLTIEKENEDAMIIFLSDVWFDNIKVMEKLSALLSGYSECPPVAMVFLGEFLSCPFGCEQAERLRGALQGVADLVAQHPLLLESCKFVFVPGSGDPAAPNILPRPPLPEYVTAGIRAKLGDSVIFTSNPCRLQYCTQQLVVLRHDLVTKMCRNALHFPETGDIPDHYTKTLLSQCTLVPLSLGVQPVHWQHADALNLYPTPDLVVIADHYQPFTRQYQGCQLVNPGSFPRTEYSFKVYMPYSRTVEDSQMPKDD